MKKKVSLKAAAEAIDALVKELEELEDVKGGRAENRVKALKASLHGTALLLRSECWGEEEGHPVYEFPN